MPHHVEWKKRFLLSLSHYGNVKLAAAHAGISRRGAYKAKKSDKKFRKKWKEALKSAMDVLHQEARRRAVDGVTRNKPHFHNGELIHEEPITTYSDTLLIFLMKAHDPKTYRDNHHVKHTGKVKSKVDIDQPDAFVVEFVAPPDRPKDEGVEMLPIEPDLDADAE